MVDGKKPSAGYPRCANGSQFVASRLPDVDESTAVDIKLTLCEAGVETTVRASMPLAEVKRRLGGDFRPSQDLTPETAGDLLGLAGATVRRYLNGHKSLRDICKAYRLGEAPDGGARDCRPWRIPAENAHAFLDWFRRRGQIEADRPTDSGDKSGVPANPTPHSSRRAHGDNDDLGQWRKVRNVA